MRRCKREQLGVRYDVLSIEPMFDTTLKVLEDVFAGLPPDTTEENIQARCRGVLLMAISNKTGKMLLTTGNKSEMAVGYATLYGDMAGGFAPLKDCTQDARLSACELPQQRLARHPGARSHARADGRAARQPEGQRLAAPVRRARCDPRSLHREGLLRRPDHGARLRSRDGRARAADGEARGVQTSAGAARRQGQQPGIRPGLAVPDHVGVLESGSWLRDRRDESGDRISPLTRLRRLELRRRCLVAEGLAQHAARVGGEIRHAELLVGGDQDLQASSRAAALRDSARARTWRD